MREEENVKKFQLINGHALLNGKGEHMDSLGGAKSDPGQEPLGHEEA